MDIYIYMISRFVITGLVFRMWLAVIVFVIILGLLVYLDTKKPKNFPPGNPTHLLLHLGK